MVSDTKDATDDTVVCMLAESQLVQETETYTTLLPSEPSAGSVLGRKILFEMLPPGLYLKLSTILPPALSDISPLPPAPDLHSPAAEVQFQTKIRLSVEHHQNALYSKCLNCMQLPEMAMLHRLPADATAWLVRPHDYI